MATIRLTLPDGSVREVPAGTTARQVAQSIGAGLARAAVAARVDGQVRDLDRPLTADAPFAILTEKDPASLDVLRHSAAHILATAVRELFPTAAIGFGPAIEDGFYYDFGVERPFTPEDLQAIEARMAEVATKDYPFVREEVSRDEANRRFKDDPLKLERIADLGADEVISVYTDGPFVDLCRGPHMTGTGRLKHFKLLSAAGAYWRGDSRRQMLQRIYGTAWWKKEDLEAYLHRIEEAKKRDHRKLGKELDLFLFHPFAPGAAFWTERGTSLYNALNGFMRELQRDGYQEIRTPLLYNKGLWEISGHWGKYRENMFLVHNNETGEQDMSLKPMNCPSHHLLYGSAKHSYKALPIRYSTYDVLHRNEVSGALSGLTRVRQFAQDDCHIYLMESQIPAEVKTLTRFILDYYTTFGLKATLKFATRPSSGSAPTRCGTAPRARSAPPSRPRDCPTSSRKATAPSTAPKIDGDVARLRQARTWQLGTIQLDYAKRTRFDLTCVGEDNESAAGGHPPRGEQVVRAVHRHPDRALRRRVSLWLSTEQVR